MISISSRSELCSKSWSGTPDLHFSSVDNCYPMLAPSAPHSMFSLSLSLLDPYTSPLLFRMQQLFQRPKFSSAHYAISDIGIIPEEDSEERERTESACADICPSSVTFHPGIPQTGIVCMHLIVLSTFSSMNLPNHLLNPRKFITASHEKKFHSPITHYTRDSISLFSLNL